MIFHSLVVKSFRVGKPFPAAHKAFIVQLLTFRGGRRPLPRPREESESSPRERIGLDLIVSALPRLVRRLPPSQLCRAPCAPAHNRSRPSDRSSKPRSPSGRRSSEALPVP